MNNMTVMEVNRNGVDGHKRKEKKKKKVQKTETSTDVADAFLLGDESNEVKENGDQSGYLDELRSEQWFVDLKLKVLHTLF